MVALCLALLQTSPPDVAVTYATRGKMLVGVLQEIGKKAGVNLETTINVGSEIVIVDVKDAKLSDLIPRLAKVAGGEWQRAGDGYRITRPDTFARKSRAQEIEEAAQALAKVIAARKQALPAFGPAQSDQLAANVQNTLARRKAANDSEYFRAMQDHGAQSPSGRLAIRALTAFGAKALAELRPEDRFVFSTRPNAMQRAIPFDLTPLLAQYRQEQTIYAKSLQTRIDAKQMQGWYSGAVQPTVPPPPSKVLLSLERQPIGGGIELGIFMIDGENRIAQEVNVQIDAPGDDRFLSATAPADPKDPIVPLAETSKQFLEVARGMMNNASIKLPPTLEKELEQPERHDPVSFILPDGLRAVAEGRNVVAQVEDMAFIFAASNADAKGEIGKDRFGKWLEKGHDVERSRDWLIVTPRQPWDARETRINRGLLGRFYRDARENGTDLDQVAEFVRDAPRRYIETISFIYSFLLQPQVNSAIEMDNIDFVRLYGYLPPETRKGLKEGTTYRLGNLPQGAKNELARLAYRAEAPLQFTTRAAEENESTRPIAKEPTEAMPNGIPGTATLSGNLTGEPAVIGQLEAGGSGYANRPMRPWDLAFNLALDDGKTHRNDLVRYSRFKYGRMGTLKMAVKYTENLGVEQDIILSDFPRSTPWLEFAQLPAPFREAVQKHLPEAKEQVAQMRKSEAANKVPPP